MPEDPLPQGLLHLGLGPGLERLKDELVQRGLSFEVPPCGISAWQSQDSQTLYMVVRSSKSKCFHKQGGICMPFNDVTLEVTQHHFTIGYWYTVVTEPALAQRGHMDSTSQEGMSPRTSDHVLKPPLSLSLRETTLICSPCLWEPQRSL